MTTRKPKAKTPRRKSAPARPRTRKTPVVVPPPEETVPAAAPAPMADDAVIVTSAPEPAFAARVPLSVPPRPLPDTRRGIFFDVENTSRAEHVARVLQHLGLDWTAQTTDLTAVGNWRVIGHETARLLAQRGAHLVHSAPSVGVRDWSDLRIAVAAGVWLASGRPGDAIVIVSDDQAFDAVGDVAASLGVRFQRLSYRALAGMTDELPVEEQPAVEPRPRRRSRGGRGRRSWPRSTSAAAPATSHPVPVAPEVTEGGPHTAPHDELLAVVRELVATAPGGVNLDNLSNALKSRGFARPPGSPRLITRLRRIKELEVGRNGAIRLVDGNAAAAEPVPHPLEPGSVEPDDAAEEAAGADETSAPEGEEPAGEPGTGAPRRRRRRGGRRRRGRGRNGTAATASAPDVPV